MTRLRVVAPLVIASALLSRAAEANDATGKVLLEWSSSVDPQCVAREPVAADVASILRRDVFANETDADRVLRVELAGASPHFTGSLSLKSARGEPLGVRELDIASADCREVASSLALAISIMADLPRSSAERAAEAEKENPPAEPPRSPPPPPPRPPPPPVRPSWHALAALGATLAVDSNGDPEVGGALTAIFEPHHFWPFSGTILMTPRVSHTPDGLGYSLLSTTVGATLCIPPWRSASGRLTGFACLGPDLGIHVGWGDGFTNSRAGLSSTVGGLFQSLVTYSFARRWRLLGGILATATPQSVSLRANASQTFYETPKLSIGLTIGVSFDFF